MFRRLPPLAIFIWGFHPVRSLRFKFILVALLICVFAVGMAGFLNYYKFKGTIGGVVQSRMLVVGNNIENGLQNSLSLGLSFAEIGTAPALIAREKSVERLITGIEVFDTLGHTVYSTDPARVGQRVPETWLRATRQPGARNTWSIESGPELGVGITVKNNFGVAAGHVLVRYSGESVAQAVGEMASRLVAYSLSGLAIAAIFLIVMLNRLLRPLDRDIHRLEQAIGDEAAESPPAGPGSALAQAAGELRKSLRETRQGLDQIESALDRVR